MATPEQVAEERKKIEKYLKKQNVEDYKKEADKLITKYSKSDSGGFEKMWSKTRKKYETGEATGTGTKSKHKSKESAAAAQAAAQFQPTSDVPLYDETTIGINRMRLLEFYQQYAPEKVGDVDKNIDKYSRMDNGFDLLWNSLNQKYLSQERSGEAQPQASASQPKVNAEATKESTGVKHETSNFAQQPPSEAGGKSYTTSGTRSQAQQRGALQGQQNAAAEMVISDEQRKRLRRFYLHYAPHRVDEIEANIAQYANPRSGGYPAMWEQLTRQYGPEPPATGGDAMAALFDDSGIGGGKNGAGALRYSEAEREQWRQRLKKFYAFYAPEKKDSDIEFALNQYSPPDGYERMWDQLLKKYDAQPVAPMSGLMKRFLPEPASPASPNSPGVAASRDKKKDDEDGNSHLRARYDTTGQITNLDEDGPLSDLSPLSTAHTERGNYSPLGYNTTAVVLHALLRLQGTTVAVYQRAIEERRAKFRRAVELEVALNLGIDKKNIRVTDIHAGMAIELDIELSHEQVTHGVGEMLVTKVLMGTFTVRHIRESYRTDLGGNPMQVHAEGAALFGGSCTPHFDGHPGVSERELAEREVLKRAISGEPEAVSAMGAFGPTDIGDWPPAKAQSPIGASTLGSPALKYEQLSPKIRSSLSSPSPARGEADSKRIIATGDELTKGSMNGALNGTASSPLSKWTIIPPTLPTGPEIAGTSREKSISLMNPHNLKSSPPRSAPNTVEDIPSISREQALLGSTFLESVWRDKSEKISSLPYSSVPPQAGEHHPHHPLIGPQPVRDQMRRETLKPNYLNDKPSTDSAPLPARTAPPTYSEFAPGSVMEQRSSGAQMFRETERNLAQERANDLLSAIRAPGEHMLGSRFDHPNHSVRMKNSFGQDVPPPKPRAQVVTPREVAVYGPADRYPDLFPAPTARQQHNPSSMATARSGTMRSSYIIEPEAPTQGTIDRMKAAANSSPARHHPANSSQPVERELNWAHSPIGDGYQQRQQASFHQDPTSPPGQHHRPGGDSTNAATTKDLMFDIVEALQGSSGGLSK